MTKLLCALVISAVVAIAPPVRASVSAGGERGASCVAMSSEALDPSVRGCDVLALVSSLDARNELLSASGGMSQDGARGESAKSFALSLIIPGAGQIARGEKRGYLYLLAEVALWAGFYALDSKGLDERGDYEAYADTNWDDEAYFTWYQEFCVDCGDDCAGSYDCRPIAEYGTQEYYEDIGKYQTYWRWWNTDGDEDGIDWDDYSSGDVSVRNEYWGMRDVSNRHLRQARQLMMVALLNHVVSGVDAFLSSNRDDAGGETAAGDLGLEFNVPDHGEGLTCALVARY